MHISNNNAFPLAKRSEPAERVYVSSEEKVRNAGGRAYKRKLELNPRQERESFFNELIDDLVETGQVFVYNGQVYTDWGGQFELVAKPNSFGQLCGELVNIVKPGKPSAYVPLPTNDAAYVMDALRHRSRLLPVRQYVQLPVLEDDNQVVNPGYNPLSGLYYEGPAITAVPSREHLDRLLQAIPFKRDVDRTNFLGFLLTLFLVPRLQGQLPIVMIGANQAGVGKSTAAYVLALIAASHLATITWEKTDWALEKAIAAAVMHGSTHLLLDNIAPPENAVITSPSIERTATAKDFCFHPLQTYEQFRGPNHLWFIGTINRGTFKVDFSSRCVFNLLHYDGNPAARKEPEKTGPILEYVEAHRDDLVAELLGFFEPWRRLGCQPVPVPCRFRTWAAMLNGVLQAQGYNDFLSTYAIDRGRGDEIHEALEELAFHHPEIAKRPVGWLKDITDHNLLTNDLKGLSQRGKETAVGLLFRRVVGDEVLVTEEEQGTARKYRVTFEGKDTNKSALYAFRQVAEEPAAGEGPEPQA